MFDKEYSLLTGCCLMEGVILPGLLEEGAIYPNPTLLDSDGY